MENQATKRIELRIIGQVQGVFFRQGIKEQADRLGVVGWVRNEPDGSVRVIAEGEEEELQDLIGWCRKGTEWARIDEVQAELGEATSQFIDFEIR